MPHDNLKNGQDERRQELAMIHIAKKQIGMDDLVYREMLFAEAGVNSAADLDAGGRKKVLDRFKSLGFKSAHKSAKGSGMIKTVPPDRKPMLSKIEAILADMGLSWGYADGMSKRMFGVDRVRWLYPYQMHKLLAALCYYQNRKKTCNHIKTKTK